MNGMVKIVLLAAVVMTVLALSGCSGVPPSVKADASGKSDEEKQLSDMRLIARGKEIFRYDTFGDEAYWGDTLRLHLAIAGEKNGGAGPGLSPAAALEAGLKVDAAALPSALVDSIRKGDVDLNDPATTIALLQLNAVVGVKAFFGDDKKVQSVGITCALCHSTVDDSFSPGIGARLDGWPNRDLNVGAVVSLAPNLQPVADRLGVDVATVKTVLASWGPGKYDAELNMDGKAFRPDGKTGATLLPPAYGLLGVNLHTYSGWGSVTYWNAYVGITQMRGQGRFYDPRMNDAAKFPVAVKTGEWKINAGRDMVSSKLPALHIYQLSLVAPVPPAGSFNEAAAARGEKIFNGGGRCSECHIPPTYSEPGWSMHSGAEIGIDDFQSSRSPDGMYRTTPLKGLFSRMKGGFYHDGRFAALMDVVDHYDSLFGLSLSGNEKNDLVEFLKSL